MRLVASASALHCATLLKKLGTKMPSKPRRSISRARSRTARRRPGVATRLRAGRVSGIGEQLRKSPLDCHFYDIIASSCRKSPKWRCPDDDACAVIISLLRRYWPELHRIGAVAVAERRGVDFFELDLAGQHLSLPGILLGDVGVEFGHHLAREKLKAFADMLVGVLAGLVEQDHLVDMRGLEAAQLAPDRLGRADEATAQRALQRIRVFALPLLRSE